MKTSLICTVFNEEKSIISFIKSLNNQIEKPDEVVIVDGGSSDNTVDLIKRHLSKDFKLNLIVDPSCSRKYCVGPIAKGRNIAIENATHEIILVTDAGCALSEKWVFEMKRSFSGNVDVVSGNYSANPGNSFQNYIAHMFCPTISVNNPKDFLPSSRSLAFKKKIWIQVGGYPTNSYTGEDTKFDLEMFKVTDAVTFNEKAIVYWDLPKNWREMIIKVFNYGVGDGQQLNFFATYILRLIVVIFPPLFIIAMIVGGKKAIAYLVYIAQVLGYSKGVFLRMKRK